MEEEQTVAQECEAKGGQWDNGKCHLKTYNTKKPSYSGWSPFNMYEAWIGLIAMLSYGLVNYYVEGVETSQWILPASVYGVIGFLIGWGVHYVRQNHNIKPFKSYIPWVGAGIGIVGVLAAQDFFRGMPGETIAISNSVIFSMIMWAIVGFAAGYSLLSFKK